MVFVLVQGGVLFLAWRFRKRKDDDGSLPPQLHGNFKLEIGWTILPALLLAGVGAASVLTLLDLEEQPADAMEVTVIGQQWWWEYRYDVDGDGDDDIVTANDLVIPAGKPVSLTHPVARRHPLLLDPRPQRQAGRRARARAPAAASRPTSPACTAGQCTEFCGLSHAYMRMRVVALSEADYAAWQENQLEGAQIPETSWPRRAWSCSAPPARVPPRRGARRQRGGPRGGRHRGRRARVRAPRRTSPTSPAGACSPAAIFDLWVDLDGNGEIDIDEIGGEDGVFNVADLEKWLRDPPGGEADGRRPVARHARPRPHRGADRCPRRLPRDAGVAAAWRSSNDPPTPWRCPPARRRATTPLGVFARPRTKTGWRSWVSTVDHKKIGIMYGASALVFLVIGGVEALAIRVAARRARPEAPVGRPVQPGLHDARRHDDLPRRDAARRGVHELPDPAADRCPRRRLPAPQRA